MHVVFLFVFFALSFGTEIWGSPCDTCRVDQFQRLIQVAEVGMGDSSAADLRSPSWCPFASAAVSHFVKYTSEAKKVDAEYSRLLKLCMQREDEDCVELKSVDTRPR